MSVVGGRPLVRLCHAFSEHSVCSLSLDQLRRNTFSSVPDTGCNHLHVYSPITPRKTLNLKRLKEPELRITATAQQSANTSPAGLLPRTAPAIMVYCESVITLSCGRVRTTASNSANTASAVLASVHAVIVAHRDVELAAQLPIKITSVHRSRVTSTPGRTPASILLPVRLSPAVPVIPLYLSPAQVAIGRSPARELGLVLSTALGATPQRGVRGARGGRHSPRRRPPLWSPLARCHGSCPASRCRGTWRRTAGRSRSAADGA